MEPTNNDPISDRIRSLGGEGILSASDALELAQSVRRVLAYMIDGIWRSASQVRLTAGENGQEATEGLRRLREIRKIPGLSVQRRKQPGGKRQWLYRVAIKGEGDPAQLCEGDDPKLGWLGAQTGAAIEKLRGHNSEGRQS